VHAVEEARAGEVGEVPADGLERHVEALRQILDEDPPLPPRDLEDLSLTKAEGHGRVPRVSWAGRCAIAAGRSTEKPWTAEKRTLTALQRHFFRICERSRILYRAKLRETFLIAHFRTQDD